MVIMGTRTDQGDRVIVGFVDHKIIYGEHADKDIKCFGCQGNHKIEMCPQKKNQLYQERRKTWTDYRQKSNNWKERNRSQNNTNGWHQNKKRRFEDKLHQVSTS